MTAEDLAKLFHETYEDLAPEFAYETRLASRKPWELVPDNNKQLMVAVAGKVMASINYNVRRQSLAIASVLDIIDRLPKSDGEALGSTVNTIRILLRFGVGLDITEEEQKRLAVIDPELAALGEE